MSREFNMGIRLNYYDNDFTRGIREATRHTNEFRDGMAKASTGADSFVGKLGGIAAALGGIAAVKKAFDWMVGANANMEQYQNTLTVVLRSQEKAISTLEWANKFAAQTPFEIPQIVEATTRLSAYGMEAQKVLGVTGDMASVMGKDLMQAVEAVADAQTGELERLKEFGITKSMIQDQAKLLGSSPIDNKGSITDMKAFNAALFSLMEDRFKGGMEMQSKSFKGMLSNVSDFMGTMGRELGKPLFDRAKQNLENFLGTLNRLKDSGALDAFIRDVHKAGAVVENEIAYAGSIVRAGFGYIYRAAAPVFKFIRDNWEDIKPFVQGVAIAIGAVVSALAIMKTYAMAATVVMRMLSAAMLTNPVGWLILGIGLLVGWFIKLNGGIDGTKAKLTEWYNTAKKIAGAVASIFSGNVFDGAKGLLEMGFTAGQVSMVIKGVGMVKQAVAALGTAWAWLQAKAVDYWPTIQATILGVCQGIQTVVMGVAAAVIPVVVNIATSIVNAFTKVLNWAAVIWPAVQKIVTVAFGIITLAWAYLGPYIMAALSTIGSIITGGFQVIMAVIQFVWTTITSIISIALAVISGLIQTALGLLTGDWEMAWNGIKTIFEGIWNGIIDFLGGLGKLFYDSGAAIITTLVDGIKSMAMAPVNAIKGVMETVRDFLPFSDAKKGPLSELTYSGGAIMTTLSTGVDKKAGALQDAVSGAFSSAALGMDMSAQVTATAAPVAAEAAFTAGSQAVAPVAFSTAPTLAPAASFSETGTNIAPAQVSAVAAPAAQAGGASFTFGSLVEKIELHATKDVDADSLVDQFIDRLHARAKEAAAILSSADKGALV